MSPTWRRQLDHDLNVGRGFPYGNCGMFLYRAGVVACISSDLQHITRSLDQGFPTRGIPPRGISGFQVKLGVGPQSSRMKLLKIDFWQVFKQFQLLSNRAEMSALCDTKYRIADRRSWKWKWHFDVWWKGNTARWTKSRLSDVHCTWQSL